MTALKTETGRAAVLTLESLARRLDELADRAFDVSDRYSSETDAELAAQISLLNGIADSCVWSCHTDFDDERGLERLRFACEKASKAWTFLRTAAAIQRTLKEPSAEDRAFILERLKAKMRAGSGWYRAEGETLRLLTIPGTRGTNLESVIYHCTQLAQVRRVLRSVGLTVEAGPDADSLTCAGEVVASMGVRT